MDICELKGASGMSCECETVWDSVASQFSSSSTVLAVAMLEWLLLLETGDEEADELCDKGVGRGVSCSIAGALCEAVGFNEADIVYKV